MVFAMSGMPPGLPARMRSVVHNRMRESLMGLRCAARSPRPVGSASGDGGLGEATGMPWPAAQAQLNGWCGKHQTPVANACPKGR